MTAAVAVTSKVTTTWMWTGAKCHAVALATGITVKLKFAFSQLATNIKHHCCLLHRVQFFAAQPLFAFVLIA